MGWRPFLVPTRNILGFSLFCIHRDSRRGKGVTVFCTSSSMAVPSAARPPSLRFNDHFSRRTSVSQVLRVLRMMEVVVTTGAVRRAKLQSNVTTNGPTPSFLQAGCSPCRQTNSVTALKGYSIYICVVCEISQTLCNFLQVGCHSC